ncbi:membrane protein insertion efficiency factor YidD [Methylobacterium isbiliense]|uniref:membrane protein insertion efficiency factor YidD n=1 Tax=Methylobacterium isbiliense TaxID=315478 RepID=UPI001EE32457|nr:membrane protein insertion efficiency factor YidD [Methylobacterium isbiliense]MDN3624690.1 membrane protein insertion efficiency factor YidD [Methylobacterium isbiliense]
MPRRAARLPRRAAQLPRCAAHGAIRFYQLTLSSLVGRQCRHWPSCSAYTDEAIQRHGLWAGGWMGFSRICRCGPFGTHGIDLVPERLPAGAAWHRPWAYGRWRGVNAPPSPFVAEEAEPPRA